MPCGGAADGTPPCGRSPLTLGKMGRPTRLEHSFGVEATSLENADLVED
jgi:hypothetical protein